MQGFAGNTERVETLRSGHGDDDVGVRQKIAAGVIDRDDALANIAGAIGDDGGGSDADVSVPNLLGLRVPCDLDRLADGEFADLRLVEVGVNLNFVEIGDVDQVFPGWDKVVSGDGNGVDGSCLRGSDIERCVAALGGGERGAGVVLPAPRHGLYRLDCSVVLLRC